MVPNRNREDARCSMSLNFRITASSIWNQVCDVQHRLSRPLSPRDSIGWCVVVEGSGFGGSKAYDGGISIKTPVLYRIDA